MGCDVFCFKEGLKCGKPHNIYLYIISVCLLVFMYVYLGLDIHCNLRTESRRKFVLVGRYKDKLKTFSYNFISISKIEKFLYFDYMFKSLGFKIQKTRKKKSNCHIRAILQLQFMRWNLTRMFISAKSQLSSSNCLLTKNLRHLQWRYRDNLKKKF